MKRKISLGSKVVTALTIGMIGMTSAIPVFANSYTIDKDGIYVDSNTWTTVTSLKKVLLISMSLF